jgi:DtxR family Mn-dependent transcriptional regulator
VASLTIENYVKAIYQIGLKQVGRETVTTGEIAECLEVSPGTVTSMLKTLSEAGLANYIPYEGAQLTTAGRTLALRVLRRHRLIELFLVHTLNLTWDEVHDEAENMEHAVSDLLIDRIDAYLGYPASDPHGDPIPKADGTIAEEAGRMLAQLSVGERFQIIRVRDQTPDFLRYLTQSGLQLGAEGKVAAIQPEAGVVTVEVNGQSTTLARQIAEQVMVVGLPRK